MILGNNEPHQVYMQVNALDPWVCGLEPTGVPCLHEWATVRSCDKLSRPNMVSEPMVQSKMKNGRSEKNGVPTLIDYSHMQTWRGFACKKGCWNGLSHINKLKMVCTFYRLLEPFFPLSYDSWDDIYLLRFWSVCTSYFPVNIVAFTISLA